MNVTIAILIKLSALLVFAVMWALVRYLGDTIPLGQAVFFRSAFAIIPLLSFLALRGELASAVRTSRPLGHLTRGLIGVTGMVFNFSALARLPLVEVNAITFAAPLITVALAALLLKEKVKIFRWSAVAVGFCGVLLILWPHLHFDYLVDIDAPPAQTIGAMCALGAAFTNAAAIIQTRRLTGSETTASIVLYFSLTPLVVGAASLPFDWRTPDHLQFAVLVAIGVLGGLGQILLTESYRYASASVLAPFDYVSLLFAFVCGYALFREVPSQDIFFGAAIVVLSGLFVVFRERKLAQAHRNGLAIRPPAET